jgi:hypothetical protein
MIAACKTSADPVVSGIYQTWDDVIARWIGKHKEDLYLELGPPSLHPKEAEDGTVENGLGHDDRPNARPGG